MDKIKSHPTFQSYTSQKKRLPFLFYANFIFDWIIEQSVELKNWISPICEWIIQTGFESTDSKEQLIHSCTNTFFIHSNLYLIYYFNF